MGLFSRLGTLIRSNINELINKAEDPEKMLNQVLVDMKTQLVEAKKQVAVAIADEKRLKMANQIGYPNKWKTYDFKIDRKTWAANSIAARTCILAAQFKRTTIDMLGFVEALQFHQDRTQVGQSLHIAGIDRQGCPVSLFRLL